VVTKATGVLREKKIVPECHLNIASPSGKKLHPQRKTWEKFLFFIPDQVKREVDTKNRVKIPRNEKLHRNSNEGRLRKK